MWGVYMFADDYGPGRAMTLNAFIVLHNVLGYISNDRTSTFAMTAADWKPRELKYEQAWRFLLAGVSNMSAAAGKSSSLFGEATS